MLDIGWSEMLVVAVVAIVVVGPKDLPRLLRTVGGYVGKVRRMAGEFQKQLNDAVRESELDDVRKEVQAIGATGDKMAADVNKSMRIPPKPSGAPIKVIPAGTPPVSGLATPMPAAGTVAPAEPVPALVASTDEPELPLLGDLPAAKAPDAVLVADASAERPA